MTYLKVESFDAFLDSLWAHPASQDRATHERSREGTSPPSRVSVHLRIVPCPEGCGCKGRLK